MAEITNYPWPVSHPFLHSEGNITDLATLGASFVTVRGLNNNGQIVGGANTSGGAIHAYLYSGGTMSDLNTLIDINAGWTLQVAGAINDLGQIAGWGINASGQYRAFLLTKIPQRFSLHIELNQGLLISWPTNAIGCAPFRNSDLTSTNWEAVTNIPTMTNGQYQVTISGVSVGQQFYRLICQ